MYHYTPTCVFVDHTTENISILGALLQAHNLAFSQQQTSSVRLITCQRYELYAYNQISLIDSSEFTPLNNKLRLISGEYNIIYRLACIAAGSESMLLGERFIPTQIAKAFRRVNDQSALKDICNKAMNIAELARNEFEFYALSDYGDIAYELLRIAPVAKFTGPRKLAIFGSGMLGRALAEHENRKAYDQVYAVSRWPKDLKKKIRSTDVHCVHPETISKHLGDSPFDVIMAISTITNEYILFLREFLQSKQMGYAVDLSTVPAISVDRPSNYIHEYDKSFCDFLKAKSEPLFEKRGKVQAFIAERTACVTK